MTKRKLPELIRTVLDGVAGGRARRGGPAPAGTQDALTARWRADLGELLPEQGRGAQAALAELVELLAEGSVDPADPRCAAHLQCPPLDVAVAADLVVSLLNPSLDSWDQGPAASQIETEVIASLAGLVGYPPGADGTLTTGGSESNLMGLLLARERAVAEHCGVSATRAGLPDRHLRVLCSEAAHFSVARAGGFLGLGEDAVLPVPAGHDHRMDVTALGTAIGDVAGRGEIAMAIVATAGTTDLGAIDPLPQIADLASATGTWLHVDAAYGGGALFSPALAPLLDGIARADSVSVDLHKIGWQPVAAGVFLARHAADLAALARRVEYLNTADDEAAGYRSLLGRSMRTTRRPDAVKVAVTMRALGRAGLAERVERCHELTRHAAA